MQVVVIKKENLYKYPFPNEYISTYWIKDYDDFGNERDLLAIEKVNDTWMLLSNEKCKIIDNNEEVDSASLTLNKFYLLKIINKNSVTNAVIYACNENDTSYESYYLEDGEYTIGSSSYQNIILNSNMISKEHAILIKNNDKYTIKTRDVNFGIYVNDKRVNVKPLENGDIIFIMGYKMIILNSYLIINNYINGITINTPKITKKELPQYMGTLEPPIDDENAELYTDNDYYSRAPRFVTSIIEEDFKIDSPPGKVEPDNTPVLFTIGPMLTMSMSSIVSASVTILNYQKGKTSLISIMPTLVLSATMLISTILWPSLTRRYQKKRALKKEEERQRRYSVYLREKRNKIENMRVNQYQILMENYPEPKNLEPVILNKKRTLWERQIKSNDFLRVRIGVGTIPLKIRLSYAIEDFSMIDDNLKDELKAVGESAKDIPNAPVTISLTERNKLVLIGENNYKDAMLKSILLQLATYHSYDELKLVLMLNDKNSDIWEDIKILPHIWSNSREIRYYANNYDDMSKISFYLEQTFMSRKYTDNNGKRVETGISHKDVSPYYLIIVDNIKKNKNIEIINKILKEERNLGFGLIILNDGIGDLPNECSDFLTAAGEKSAIIKNDLNKDNQQLFIMDQTDDIDISLMCERLANIPIKLPMVLDEQKSFIGFLEMYKVGKIESLNILNRWQTNNPVNSLNVPIGIHTNGDTFNLDLHEKFHGPHGLIAGMTGSGKSEFIITFILSMCLNFSPEEVSFVLIDYKGGGLTGAFENKLTGVRLPHLAGTITNLDTAEIKRSLSSIQSELKRRQELFNQAKLQLNESTIDIYKYQKLYRDGQIKEPISHLFIISDEFAELKSQQPDFMDELISAARIGRSLGVHLILATQKPSGIVDDQIWSNSKFKICLKVQEKADSMEVIKCPDAASLKNVGRFYLQVGYNDYFAMGQGAYAGVKYIPRDKIAKTVDRSLSFINNIGDTIKSTETVKRENLVSHGEELPNILKYIYETAKTKGIEAKRLWLDKLGKFLYVNNLMKKYSFKSEKWNITSIIGEYDDPKNQNQGLLTLDFNNSGNTLIYGVTGKEIMLTSLIYSVIISHTAEEINFYIVDFGTEMFGMFKNAPQVGDVIYITESEKLNNLLSTINTELERRKKLFVEYNGDYNMYIKQSGRSVPRIIVIINNYEVFTETYEEYIDVVAGLTREGERYGISFVISATGVNAVRGKTTQNFNKQLCLDFNDPSDYISVLGATRGMIPSEGVGRGLVKIKGELFEYQTAYPCKWSEVNTFIRMTCQKLNEVIKTKAPKIAVLPHYVRLEDIEHKITDIRNIPIGIVKNTLEVSTFNFNKNLFSLVSAQDMSFLEKFIPSLGQVFQKINNIELYMIDSNENLKDPKTFQNYYGTNCNDALNKLEEITKTNNNKINIFIIFGLDTFKNSLSMENQIKLKKILQQIKTTPHIRVIIADAVSKIKTFEYDDFYRENVQPINGIWIGSGITEQFTIKSSTYTRETRAQIESDFGYNVNRGIATLVKLLDFYTKE